MARLRAHEAERTYSAASRSRIWLFFGFSKRKNTFSASRRGGVGFVVSGPARRALLGRTRATRGDDLFFELFVVGHGEHIEQAVVLSSVVGRRDDERFERAVPRGDGFVFGGRVTFGRDAERAAVRGVELDGQRDVALDIRWVRKSDVSQLIDGIDKTVYVKPLARPLPPMPKGRHTARHLPTGRYTKVNAAASPVKPLPPLGSGERFKNLSNTLAAKGARNPDALAAFIGRKKLGAGRFNALARKGK